MFKINQNARENFDRKALEILTSVKPRPPVEHSISPIPSEAHVTTALNDSDIVGDMTQFGVDAKGRVTERTFSYEGSRVGLTGSDYLSFAAIAENVQRLGGIRDRVSVKFVEDSLFSWAKEAYQSGIVKIQFSEYLESCALKTIKKLRVYVPMAFMTVESSFQFGDVNVENISKALIDAHLPSSNSMTEEVRPHWDKYIEKFRTDFQGYAAIRLDLECEPNFAKELSIDKSRATADLLGLYSGKVLIPDARCSSRPKGAEFIEQSTVIISAEGNPFQVMQNIVDIDAINTWTISQNQLAKFRKWGFCELSDLLKSGGITEFEKAILNVAFLYSKCAFSSAPMEKVVYILSALESIFLKNQGEPIQQNLGERVAIFSATELDKRKAILKNIRAVYDLRSRYLHHGHSSAELETIQIFLANVWICFVKLVYARKDFDTKDDFLSNLDDQKMS